MAKGGIFNILIILAVLLAALMIFLVTRLIKSAKEEGIASAKPVQVEMVNILTAAEDITPGTELRAEMVPVKSVPKEFVTADTVTSFDQIKDKVAGSFIPAGDIIFTSKVKSPEQLSKASLVVESGKRLITFPADQQISVAFMVKNGDHVDLLATFGIEKVEKDIEGNWVSRDLTVTLLQNVKIFDIQYGSPPAPVGKDGGGEGDGEAGRLGKGSTLTFEVTPEESERLMAAFGKAKNFRMTLRRFDDVTINKPSSVMDSEVVKPFLPAEPPPPPVKVEEAKPTPSKPKYNY